MADLTKFEDPKRLPSVAEILDLERQWSDLLSPWFRRIVSHHKLYLADRPDMRKKNEQWRSWTFVPYPFSLTETKVAGHSEIMDASDPWIQAAEVGTEDKDKARAFEATMQYTLLQNDWPYTREMYLRDLSIQGMAVVKPVWRNRVRTVIARPTAEQRKAFDLAIESVQKLGAPGPDADPVSDPEGFKRWRDLVNRAKIYGTIPEPPVPGPKQLVDYRGPYFDSPSIFDLRFDPFTEDWSEMHTVMHRVVKTREWVLDRTGPGEQFLFDPDQVKKSIGSWGGTGTGRLSEWDQEIAGRLGIAVDSRDPVYQDGVELFEIWRPNAKYGQWLVMLNRNNYINKPPFEHPYWHRQLVFLPIRNIPMRRRAMGLGDYFELERLFQDINTFRDLRMDALLLAVLPIFLRLRDLGVPELQRFMRPGMIIDALNAQGLQKAWGGMERGFSEALREEQALKTDIDDTAGTPPAVRGQTATVGRISATEQTARLQQALNRQKQTVSRIETEFSRVIPQCLMLWYQRGPEKVRRELGGRSVGDPFMEIDREDFLEALRYDLRFRSGTKALNRELTAQNLADFMAKASQIQPAPGFLALMPGEIRFLLGKVYEAMGQKDVIKVVSPEGTKILDEAMQIAVVSMRLQGQNLVRQAQAAAAGGVPPGGGAGTQGGGPEGQPVPPPPPPTPGQGGPVA